MEDINKIMKHKEEHIRTEMQVDELRANDPTLHTCMKEISIKKIKGINFREI